MLVSRNIDPRDVKLEVSDPAYAELDHERIAGDVADPAFWDPENVESPLYKQGKIDILVNAAGLSHSSLFLRTSRKTIDKVMSTNLTGTILASQAVGKKMLKDRSRTGCIINIASLLAVQGGKGSSIYAASKAGIVGLTRSLAAELGSSGIRVNCILPGYIATRMTDGKSSRCRFHISYFLLLLHFSIFVHLWISTVGPRSRLRARSAKCSSEMACEEGHHSL